MADECDIGDAKMKPMLVKDAWLQIAKVLGIPDMRIGGGVTVRLKQGDIVRVDVLGILPTETEVDVTGLTDEIKTHAPVT